jgi:hypothetical protein
MRVQMQLTNRSATVFGWLMAQEARVHRAVQLMALRRALRAAYARFAAGHQLLAESLFDAHFVQTRVAPLLAQALDADAGLTPEAVARAWFAGCRGARAEPDDARLGAIRAAAAELLAYVEQELRPEQRQVAATAAELAESDAAAAALFAEAVAANSNLELDWLWLYSRMTGAYERGYCLRKALAINPASELARRELAALERAGAPRALAPALER